MIVIKDKDETGVALPPLEYISHRGLLSRMILPVTRELRARNAMRYIAPGQRLLDIGCGDGYFLRRAPFEECYGLDKRLGDDISDGLPFETDFFDAVTMLAVIEHIADVESLLAETFRVLKPGGQLVLTTPKKAADVLIRIYVRDLDEEHDTYFDRETITRLTTGRFEITGYHTFILGLNQAFCLRKIAP